MLIIVVATSIGVILSLYQEQLLALNFSRCVCTFLALVIVLELLRHRWGSRASHPMRWIKVVQGVLCIALGFCWGSYQGQRYLTAATESLGVHWWQVKIVEVVDLPSYRGGPRYRLELQCRFSTEPPASPGTGANCEPLGNLAGPNWHVQVRSNGQDIVADNVTSTDRGSIRLGEVWQMELTLSGIENSRSSSYDRARWAISQGIIASGTWNHATALKTQPAGVVDSWRHRIREALLAESAVAHSAFSPVDPRPLISALTMGDRSALSSEDWALLQATGTSHLMAISGLHLGIVAGWIYWLIRLMGSRAIWLNLRVPPNILATVCALLGSLCYGLLVGFPVPTQRAFLMLCFASLATLCNRPKMIIHAVALAFFIIVIWWPFSLLSASIWLSFGAICLVFWVIANRVILANKGTSHVSLLLKLQVAMFIGMLPLSAYFFSGVSLNSLLANTVAIPLVTGIMLPSCFVNVIGIELVPSLAPVITEFNLWLMDSLLSYLDWLAGSIPYQGVSFDVHRLLIALVSALFLCAPIYPVLRMLGAVIFLSTFVLPGSVGNPRVLLLNQSFPFLYFQKDEQVFTVDETPGLSFIERDNMRRFGSLAAADWPNEYRQRQWEIDQWWLASLPHSRSEQVVQVDLCIDQSLVHEDAALAHRLEIKHLWSVETPDNTSYCVLGVSWWGFRWLLIGDLPAKWLQQLLNTDVLTDHQWDFIVLADKEIQGAFLNEIEGASVFLWANRPLSETVTQRFAVRDIPLYQLFNTGSLRLEFSGDGYEITPLGSVRFYD